MATWQLQTAKARLSEVLRAVREEGPQTISVRGQEEFVVMRKEDAPSKRASKNWDDLYSGVQGAGDRLLLPTREPESTRDLQLAEDFAEWAED